jgi:L-ribulokinase
MLAWFVDTFLNGTHTFADLEAQAARLKPGETGLLAVPWWNGNRSILADADLSGVILGLNLRTSPVDTYRALLEAIAFGTKRIMDNFEEHGLPLSEIAAVGGIPARSPLLMQVLADTTGREVHVPASTEIPARGSALFGAVNGG